MKDNTYQKNKCKSTALDTFLSTLRSMQASPKIDTKVVAVDACWNLRLDKGIDGKVTIKLVEEYWS